VLGVLAAETGRREAATLGPDICYPYGVNVVNNVRDAPARADSPAGLLTLADRAAALVPEGGRAILGIVGAPGSGKTTLAEQLLAALRARHGDEWVAHVPMDGFHLADAQLRRLGSLARKGAPDTFDADGYAHLLGRVKENVDEWIYVPGFERDLEQPLAGIRIDLSQPSTDQIVVRPAFVGEISWVAATHESGRPYGTTRCLCRR